jgi:hypothetical protein
MAGATATGGKPTTPEKLATVGKLATAGALPTGGTLAKAGIRHSVATAGTTCSNGFDSKSRGVISVQMIWKTKS